MRTLPKWVNKIHEADKVEFSSVHTICFSPDGTQLVVGAGEKVMVYDPRDGALVQLLQAHKGPVHTVAYCSDGKKFASGSADKNVIIWTSKMEGVLKYSHSEAIQCLAYNPVSYHLASCAMSDFAFWSSDVKAVQKYKVSGRITSCAWSPNGQHLAIGLAIGAVSLRDKTGDETGRIVRDAAVWAVAFLKSTLVVTDWSDTISFYNMQGQQVLKDRNIDISALCISLVGEILLVGGVGGWAALSAEGVVILNTPLDWVWAVQPSPALNTMAVACQDGTLWCYQLVFSTVHGLYRERYAYRENMTDVIIQHLTTGNKVRIKCHDKVQKIAIYKHRLAVQLPERVLVYEQGDVDGMLYRVKEKLPQKSECSLLVATSDSLLLCQDTKLSMIGKHQPRYWTVPAPIRYVKVTTLYLKEILLLGLLNGQIWQVEPNDLTAKLLLQTPGSVRCVDVSASRARLAVVDDSSVCRVYSLPSAELMYTEENISSVSWNSWCDEMLSMSGNGLLSIKAGNFPSATQPVQGSVVGFQGGRVFCLQASAMQTINVPLSHAVHQYVQQKMFNEAYAVACLGVTSLDWERLGIAAMEELSLEVAIKAFQRSDAHSFLNLAHELQEQLDAGVARSLLMGEVLAHLGRYAEAASMYRTANQPERAANMYQLLRMFNKAQEFVTEGEGQAQLARKRAEWARHVTEPRAAADMYLAAGDVKSAANLLATPQNKHLLLELARKLDKGSSESLRYVAAALVTAGEPAAAAALYNRLGDYRQVAKLAVETEEWHRAFSLAREHPECKRDVYLPYAHRMATDNKFIEAQKAYYMAGETGTAMRVFSILVSNAVTEERFSDAGFLHYLLAIQCLEFSNGNGMTAISASDYEAYMRLSRIYHAYDAVHRCVHEPFSLTQPEALLNAARYILAEIEGEPTPTGVSMFCVYLCLAKQAKLLKSNAVARQALDKILAMQIPQKFQESVELLYLKSMPTGNDEGSSSAGAALCWRCRRPATETSKRCSRCRHPQSRALPSYEILPLVQFKPAEGISLEEALDLIERCPIPEHGGGDARNDDGGAEVMTIAHDLDDGDPFLDKLDEDDEDGIVVVNRNTLLQMSPNSVLVVSRGQNTVMYRNMLPDLICVACSHCQSLFYLEDYEVQMVTKGECCFCRHPRESVISDDRTDMSGDVTPTDSGDD